VPILEKMSIYFAIELTLRQISYFFHAHALIPAIVRRRDAQCKTNKKIITLLSDANVPVRFRAQLRAEYSSLQLNGNCIAAKRSLRHYFKLILESRTTENTN